MLKVAVLVVCIQPYGLTSKSEMVTRAYGLGMPRAQEFELRAFGFPSWSGGGCNRSYL